MRVETGANAPIKLWTDFVPVEERAMAQLRNTASLPFIYKHLAVMPDVHLGIGSTVGSVIPTRGAVIPAAVGVDIGCGMMAWRARVKGSALPDNLHDYRAAIESAVPVGNGPGGSHKNPLDDDRRADEAVFLNLGYERFVRDHLRDGSLQALIAQLGTLGGGNHFIEVCVDENDDVWLMLHSGSRGVGNKIGQHFIEVAREDMRVHFINLPDRDLAYLPEGTVHFNEYMHAVEWAQEYARSNRKLMMIAIVRALGWERYFTDCCHESEAIECHHNYVAREHHFGSNVLVTRKGAVNASLGRYGIIPGSMGQQSFIVRGKGNSESFDSCSHGAGRAMSRTEARKRFSVEDLKQQTLGVECRKDEGVVDEIPSAYKNLGDVMASQADLVEVVHTLKAILTVKG